LSLPVIAILLFPAEMEEKITQVEGLEALAPPRSSVAIAISGSRKSKYVVRWALEKFIPEEEIFFKLLYVRPKIIAVPTPSKYI
jgi:hypothetical protein